MEIFRHIEERFVSLDEGQRETTQRLNGITSALDQAAAALLGVSTDVKLLSARSEFMHQDITALRGAFASVEAILIANAAQMAELRARMDAVEKRLPPAA